MPKPLIAVTGKDGQLGQELQLLALEAQAFEFVFASSTELDITNNIAVEAFFKKHSPNYLINCAAYTAVDKAETEQEKALLTNASAVGILATQCRLHQCTLVTISTDYVFDGKGSSPYRPGDPTAPVNYYGYTKLLGEKLALENNPRTIVIRTSWLYSPFGKNFVKTMAALMASKPELGIVSDQTGCPTYAFDLASALLKILAAFENGDNHFGLYHFSNSGAITWFDFASAIKEETNATCLLKPLTTEQYPTPAARPAYSVMDCTDLENDFGISQLNWRSSLAACITRL